MGDVAELDIDGVEDVIAYVVQEVRGVPHDSLGVVYLQSSGARDGEGDLSVVGLRVVDLGEASQCVPELVAATRVRAATQVVVLVFCDDVHVADGVSSTVAMAIGLPSVRAQVGATTWHELVSDPSGRTPLSGGSMQRLAHSNLARQVASTGLPFPAIGADA
jgi:hypothetical protein